MRREDEGEESRDTSDILRGPMAIDDTVYCVYYWLGRVPAGIQQAAIRPGLTSFLKPAAFPL